jgi:GLPGLI family protein
MFLGNKEYSTDNKLVPIIWSVEKETRKIGGFNCQKATGRYAGRNYTAWFAAELPFQIGPFKLWGLPGLILEAEDEKQEVRFLFKDINKETDTLKRVNYLGESRPIKISNKEYLKAKIAYQKSPDTFMQGQLPANSPKVKKVYEDGAEQNSAKKVISNPIEL